MANEELEWWEQQKNQQLSSVVREAFAKGIDANKEIQKALTAYRGLKKQGLNRVLVDQDVRSEIDAVVNWLKDEIKKAKSN